MQCKPRQKNMCVNENCDVCFNRSFASQDKAQYWNYDLNGEITPRSITKFSNIKYWFTCASCIHIFSICLDNIYTGSWCPYCANSLLCDAVDCNFCFNKSFASSIWAKFYTENNEKKPREIFSGTNVKCEFKCEECDHIYYKKPVDLVYRKKISSCQYCAKTLLCGNEKCLLCLPRSFASHDKSKYWDYDENTRTPIQVLLGSHEKFWFKCDKCNHSLYLRIGHITDNNMWCAYCTHRKLCDSEDCKFCYENSFASHPKSKRWSKQNKVLPRDVFNGTKNSYMFDCEKCEHTYMQALSNATKIYDGVFLKYDGCSYCANKILCTSAECVYCFEKSFASHEKSIYWHKKNQQRPREIFLHSMKEIKFNCNYCLKDFVAIVSSVTNGSWCPLCKKTTAVKLHNWLKKKYSKLNIRKEVGFEWCKSIETKRFYPFDFVIDGYNLIIELDGEQHFKTVKRFTKEFGEIQDRDAHKMKKAVQNKFSVIRIFQMDVYGDRNNWDIELEKSIKKYDVPQCVFLETNEKYNYQNLKLKYETLNNEENIDDIELDVQPHEIKLDEEKLEDDFGPIELPDF